MRLSFILITALALALPISAQAKGGGGSKAPSGAKTPSGSATSGTSAAKVSHRIPKHVANGKHFPKGTITVGKTAPKKQ